MFAKITPKRTSHRQRKKTSNGRRSQLNQYWSYKPHSNFTNRQLFWRFCMCPSNDNLKKNKKSRRRYWGSTPKTGSLLDKANMIHPKVNRGCDPLTTNRTSADCVQISLEPSIPYFRPRVYHTGGFSAMPRNIGILVKHTIPFKKHAMITLYYAIIFPYLTYRDNIYGKTFKASTQKVNDLKKEHWWLEEGSG